jgi:hypothetical protein
VASRRAAATQLPLAMLAADVPHTRPPAHTLLAGQVRGCNCTGCEAANVREAQDGKRRR